MPNEFEGIFSDPGRLRALTDHVSSVMKRTLSADEAEAMKLIQQAFLLLMPLARAGREGGPPPVKPYDPPEEQSGV